MNRKFKSAILQIHLWLGLATGLVVFIISITGCMYVFEKEIRAYVQKDYNAVPLEKKAFVGLDSIAVSFAKTAPKETITTIRVTNAQPNATVVITSSKKHVYYFNPYTAQLVKKVGRDWLVTIRNTHTSLLLGGPGKFIMRWSVAIFFVMLLTGLVLWFPNQMRLLKQSLTIKWSASAKRINYDLHNVLGFYASGILLVICLSGLYMAFDEVKDAASFLTGTQLSGVKEKGPKKLGEGKKGEGKKGEGKKGEGKKGKKAGHKKDEGDGDQGEGNQEEGNDKVVNYNEIYTAALAKYPGAIASQLTNRKGGVLRLRLFYPSQWVNNQSTLVYKMTTGKLSTATLYTNFTTADIIESTDLDVHTGSFFGLFGKIVACIVSLISASLPVTGFIIWLKKRKKSKKGNKKTAVPAMKKQADHKARAVIG